MQIASDRPLPNPYLTSPLVRLKNLEAGKISQRIKGLATKDDTRDDTSSVPGTHVIESTDLARCPPSHALAIVNTHEHTEISLMFCFNESRLESRRRLRL